MIVRKKGDHFILIPQHDHALIAGEFASHMNQVLEPITKTLHAISYHDVGWLELDQTVTWNEETNQPYSFVDYPLAPKIEAYTHGINRIAENDSYAGFLVSQHFASFFEKAADSEGLRFLDQERKRQRVLIEQLSEDERNHAEKNFRLLQFCDDLSLSLCLNEPMHNDHPWYLHGIHLDGQTYHWVWESREKLRLTPNLFTQSFSIKIPYQIVDHNRNLIGKEEYSFHILV